MLRRSMTLFEDSNQRKQRDRAALSLTVEMLFGRYTTEGRHLPDGSLKTDLYLEHIRLTGRYLAKFFGRTQPVSELTPDRIAEQHVHDLHNQDGVGVSALSSQGES
jgi:hypothetical protein